MSNYFKVKEHGSTVRTEIMAGVTTFMAMAYILMVNAGTFAMPLAVFCEVPLMLPVK